MTYGKMICDALADNLEGKAVRFPEGAGPLVEAFEALSKARGYAAHGPQAITWEALAAWSQVMRIPIQPHHADIVMALDGVWMGHMLRRLNGSPASTVAPQALTAEMFDAGFG